jgi:hypothetical protein
MSQTIDNPALNFTGWDIFREAHEPTTDADFVSKDDNPMRICDAIRDFDVAALQTLCNEIIEAREAAMDAKRGEVE